MTTATETKEYPILFTGPMVRAILENRKTQTRRIITEPKWAEPDSLEVQDDGKTVLAIHRKTGCYAEVRCPYGQPGDRLWVRENIKAYSFTDDVHIEYYADGSGWDTGPNTGDIEDDHLVSYYKVIDRCHRNKDRQISTPSIYMPRWACRLLLEVTDVRVQRVQEITARDCVAEGIHPIGREHASDIPRKEFAALWDRINAKRGHPWSNNDLVRAVTFKRIVD